MMSTLLVSVMSGRSSHCLAQDGYKWSRSSFVVKPLTELKIGFYSLNSTQLKLIS